MRASQPLTWPLAGCQVCQTQPRMGRPCPPGVRSHQGATDHDHGPVMALGPVPSHLPLTCETVGLTAGASQRRKVGREKSHRWEGSRASGLTPQSSAHLGSRGHLVIPCSSPSPGLSRGPGVILVTGVRGILCSSWRGLGAGQGAAQWTCIVSFKVLRDRQGPTPTV